MNLRHGVAGEYKLVINRAGKTIETDWFDNIVLNSGLDRLGTGSSPMTFCRLGTGTSTPNENNLQLDSQIASTNSWAMTSATNAGAPTYHCLYTITFTFTQGAVVGNVSEIGVGWAAGPAGSLFSRALVTDANGNPTTITLLAIDQLTVFYRFRVYPSLTDSTGSFNIGTDTYTYTSRLCNATSFGQSTGAFNSWQWNAPEAINFYGVPTTIGTIISGGPNSASSTSWSRGAANGSSGNFGYVNGTYYIDSQWNFGISVGNVTGGIQGFRFSYGFNMSVFNYQAVLTTPIPKDSTKTFSITTRLSWGRF